MYGKQSAVRAQGQDEYGTPGAVEQMHRDLNAIFL